MRLTDRKFRYTPACATDIRRTFRRVLRKQREMRRANDTKEQQQHDRNAL
jgi:hypothetical protein